jgi:hypothetical protein
MAVIVPTETKSVLHNETLKGFELVNDAAAPGNSKYYGTDGSGTKGFFDLPAAGGVSSDNYYDAGSGGLTDFYVLGTTGITATSSAAGVYAITVPAAGVLKGFYFNVSSFGSELTAGGEFQLTITWTSATFNTGKDDQRSPVYTVIGSDGVERWPGDVSISVTTTSVSGGAASQTLSNVNGLGAPIAIRGQIAA